ncbi:MAG: chorismate synthase [Clostridia bacterium]|nr:chorismate synthase [Clostridia bacterium]
MKNSFGNSVAITIFGESHGKMIGAILDGLAPGIPVDEDFIVSQMAARRSVASLSTARREDDKVLIVSGVVDGITTGTPITFIIENADTRSGDYESMRSIARPGHADYTAYAKYHGFNDIRGGGHFSGRITAGLVAAGAVALTTLKSLGIEICTHIQSCAGIYDRDFGNLKEDMALLAGRDFAVLDEKKGGKMRAAIEKARSEGDSVGGRLETVITGFPAGVGEPWFDTLEGQLAHMLFSIPAIKGVEFGDGFALADMMGSSANDPFYAENGEIKTATNHNGGILGGISCGTPMLLRCAVKPTPSIYKEQQTVNFKTCENTPLQIRGRHDPAIVHRARVVVDSAVALVLCDALAMRYGTDYLAGGDRK